MNTNRFKHYRFFVILLLLTCANCESCKNPANQDPASPANQAPIVPPLAPTAPAKPAPALGNKPAATSGKPTAPTAANQDPQAPTAPAPDNQGPAITPAPKLPPAPITEDMIARVKTIKTMPGIGDTRDNVDFLVSQLEDLKDGKNVQINQPNGGNDNLTALHYAAILGDVEIIKALLNRVANTDAKNTFGWTPLLYAAYGSNKKVVQALLNAGGR